MRNPILPLVLSGLLVWACAPLPGQPGATGTVPLQLGSPVKKALSLTPATGLRTLALDVADVYKANVSVTGPGMVTPVNATGNPLSLPNGQGAATAQVIVPVGNNRVITAQGLNAAGGALPSWYVVKGVTNVAAGLNAPVAVNWTTTPTAKVVEALISTASPFAATVNTAQVQALVDQITVPVVGGGNTTYTVHPSRVDASVIAAAIHTAGGVVPGAPPVGSTIAAGSITGTISGLTNNQTATVVADDPGSPTVTTNAAGAYTISGVTPLTGITVKATQEFYDDTSTTTTVPVGGSGAANATLSPLNYLPRSLFSSGAIVNQVLRWSRMPIRILVIRPNNAAAVGWVPDHETALDEAFAKWLDQLGDKISYSITRIYDNDPTLAAQQANSDIYVEWLYNLSGSTLGFSIFGGFSYCPLCPSPKSTDLSNHIQLATHTSSSVVLPGYVYREVAAHEFGHSLGSIGDATTSGHSDVETDLLYPAVSLNTPLNLMPSARDYKTLRFIYSLPADITKLP